METLGPFEGMSRVIGVTLGERWDSGKSNGNYCFGFGLGSRGLGFKEATPNFRKHLESL